LATIGAPRSAPSSTISLNENAGAMMRPSSSGMATPEATSSGARPAPESSHAADAIDDEGAWMTGTSRSLSWGTAHSSPSAEPMASTVVTMASTWRAASRSSASLRPSGPGRSE
jgi:hypothetical protein